MLVAVFARQFQVFALFHVCAGQFLLLQSVQQNEQILMSQHFSIILNPARQKELVVARHSDCGDFFKRCFHWLNYKILGAKIQEPNKNKLFLLFAWLFCAIVQSANKRSLTCMTLLYLVPDPRD